ncbi:MAG TPA: ABC transporter ATP-binding protein, partial [Clostridia bacterium]|nr:ABC transporter ATP-binding protein [Clostridia bacterium]
LGTAILFITHDLGVIAEMADDISVMYAGRVVESCAIAELFATPLHPYTLGLLASRPSAENQSAGGLDRKLSCIKGCSFSPRCGRCMDICRERLPDLLEERPGHSVRCWLYAKEGKRNG